MDDMQKYLEEQFKNPEFKKEYDEIEPEFAIIRAILNARRERALPKRNFRSLQE